VLKHRETYEIMRAQDVGWHTNKLTLGKLSGRSAFRERLKELGIELESEVALNAAFKKFKELADKKSEIFDEDLHAIVSDEAVTPEVEQYHLVSIKAHVETGEQPYAELTITDRGREVQCHSQGAGPVDATFKALESVLKSQSELLLYSVNNVTEGTDSQGEVTVRLAKGGRVVNGIGADTDIVVASAKAYLNALNKMAGTFARVNPQAA
jgi:2-isopropylmalate synthase